MRRGSTLQPGAARGEGPGEFSSLVRVEPWPGDSIVAWFGPRLGVLVFDSRALR